MACATCLVVVKDAESRKFMQSGFERCLVAKKDA